MKLTSLLDQEPSYYVNQHTGDVQWDFPTEEAKPSSEVRASHILRKHKVKFIQ